MILFTDKNDFKSHILVRSLIDIEFLSPYEEVAIRRKIIPMIGNSVFETIRNTPALLALLKKAVAHYTIPIAIPFLKVTLNNAGISQLKDQQLEKAAWWDIRDMALQCIQIADDTLTDLVDMLLASEYKNQLPLVNQLESSLFKSPDELFRVIHQKMSYEVFLQLLPNIEYVWHTMVKQHLPQCVLEELNLHPGLFSLLQKASAFYALADLAEHSGFVFTSSGVFIQWEELPWKKASVLNEKQLMQLKNNMYKKGNQTMKLVQDYILEHKEDFPCLSSLEEENQRKAIHLKSGIYL